jgi:hypothetical protein
VQQASLCINREFETRDLNIGFKSKHSYELGTFESDLWRTEEGSERKQQFEVLTRRWPSLDVSSVSVFP